jgi:hypothetical protein
MLICDAAALKVGPLLKLLLCVQPTGWHRDASEGC